MVKLALVLFVLAGQKGKEQTRSGEDRLNRERGRRENTTGESKCVCVWETLFLAYFVPSHFKWQLPLALSRAWLARREKPTEANFFDDASLKLVCFYSWVFSNRVFSSSGAQKKETENDPDGKYKMQPTALAAKAKEDQETRQIWRYPM